ncbi:heme A synthase [Silicimonas algicola]|uniref:Heme A synthase n=1 Tax=Silicimonas algicola TaxID=1826607 RepID=A0A316GDC4_9RHOB|nr:heme A synthase [Silicimonas algicola]AZQ68083.1 heme A synthase [Silicimonas algicola]PWK57460.1 cytochrome c oxidase assembly protein subunit 15 [Silicimonas algicola]
MTTKRSIFEDVGEGAAPRAAPAGGVIDASRKGARGAVRAWLAVLFLMVVAMIAVGGLTRLTDSGLSITEWRPVTGALPPMNEADWASEFDKYKEIPEYQVQNTGMTLQEFKTIYWWEWGHRQLGRAVGLVWALGFVFFWATKRIPPGWTGRLVIPGALGGLQGAIGWWMVSSGLGGERLDVASYRLATHLGLAFVILGVLAWFILLLGRTEGGLIQTRRSREPKLFSLGTGLMHFAFLQILIGALVAGIDAGRTFNDWPDMAGQFFPPAAFDIEPAWRNFFENPGLVQFIHRMAGYLLVAFGIVAFLKGRRSPHSDTRGAFAAVLAMLVLQMILGIMTVIWIAPLWLAILHQLGAVLAFVLILRARFLAQYPMVRSIRDSR